MRHERFVADRMMQLASGGGTKSEAARGLLLAQIRHADALTQDPFLPQKRRRHRYRVRPAARHDVRSAGPRLRPRHPELYEDRWHALENRVFHPLNSG